MLRRTFASKKAPRWGKDPARPPQPETSTLPRYARRAAQADKKEEVPRFRSRHYDPTQEKSPTMRLLEPHVLSARLKKLADDAQLDTAVAMLKNAPLAAQNTPVWNTLIWECMKAKRFKLAYQLFVDMKRRGFNPTTRTFQTMFTGFSRIEVWSLYPQQLKNARSLYESYQRHIEAVKKKDPASPELSIDPLSSYVTILGNAGQFEEIFVLFYSLEHEGPLAANKFLFTAMFRALSVNTAGLTSTQYAKNATDARVLWGQMLKTAEKTGMEIDSFVVTSAVLALSKGQAAEQTLAFQLVREHFGLAASTESPVHGGNGKLPLTSPSLAAALYLCNSSQRPADCIHFFQQVIKRPPASGGADIIDRAHVEEVLKARLALIAPGSAHLSVETLEWMLGRDIRPGISTYNLVLLTCWRAADWNSATKTFNLMTGYRSHDFMDGAVRPSPRVDQGRNHLLPTAETMSCMLRTALATQNSANVRQCLRIANHFNANEVDFFDETKQITSRKKETTTNKALKNWAFHVVKLAAAVVEAVDHVAAAKTKPIASEMAQWTELKQAAVKLLSKAPEPVVEPTPKAQRTHTHTRPLTRYEMSVASSA
ncbi:pentatricopeptide repeat-containing protein [Roridomyces roridus]|uniref:Pentatricopeptide repeat-containing protein n=1 Tax=Roridomyces roridus TaxID=1738132 RepID=A0AAD7FTU4_9AGAR|nr:pentatricopeptide repeat-containing protein [Roridomyces roridus]